MTESTHHDNTAQKWLTFFFVCFTITMAIGAFAVYNFEQHKDDFGDLPKGQASGGH